MFDFLFKKRTFILSFLSIFVMGVSCGAPRKSSVQKTFPVQKTTKNASKSIPEVIKNKKIKPLVLIDAGHGGNNIGTRSLDRKYQEKNLTLKVATDLEKYLRKLGYDTLLSRRTDQFISLEERVNLAKKCQPTIFVSIHYNWAPNTHAQGLEVFYGKSDQLHSLAAKLAQNVLSGMVASTGAANRGVKQANFYVLRNTSMPSILIEGGFMSNKSEMNKLKESSYLDKQAQGIARGIHRYFKAFHH